jgi:FemAB-related protein (PEP-CTERM system-associated)
MVKEDNVEIKTLSFADAARWDKFVETCPKATFFHLSGWKKILEDSFGHKTYYLYAEENGVMQGILPLGHINSFFFGNSLISIPFCVNGGVASKSYHVNNVLVTAACALAQSLKVDYLELRHFQRYCPDWPVKNDLYVTFCKEIYPDAETNLNAIPRKQRAMVRKGIQANLKSEIDEDVNRFYDVYSESVRNLGTPVFPLKYFKSIKAAFGKDCEILTITKDNDLVASVMSFYFRDQVLPYYSGGTARARNLKANDFMYWDLMCRASNRGINIFDYGRSKVGTGSYHFKKNWGFKAEPLNYEFYLVKTDRIPNISPLNPK